MPNMADDFERMSNAWLTSHSVQESEQALQYTVAFVDALEQGTRAHALFPTKPSLVFAAIAHSRVGLCLAQGQSLFDPAHLEQYGQLQERLSNWLTQRAPTIAEEAFATSVAEMNAFKAQEAALPGNTIDRSIAAQRLLVQIDAHLQFAIESMSIAQAFETPDTRGARNTGQLRQAVNAWATNTLAYPWTDTGSHQPTYNRHVHFLHALEAIEARAGQAVRNDHGMAYLVQEVAP